MSIVLLVALAIGWREGVVVLVVIPTTILLTLFASWLMGYTINRVSLFALIFSIGILVDDAIVVVENIARHWAMHDGRSRVDSRDRGRGRGRQSDHRRDADHRRGAAADDVRLGPDGTLHEPDPGQRLGGDDILLLRRRDDHAVAAAALRGAMRRRAASGGGQARRSGGWAASTSRSRGPSAARAARSLAFLAHRRRRDAGSPACCSTPRHVTVKLLPFDNKSELQVVVDLPQRRERSRIPTAC